MKTRTLQFAVILILTLYILQPPGIISAAPLIQDVKAGIPADPPLISPEAVLYSAIYNTNLIPDGDAEINPYTTYWHDNEGYTQILAYGTSCGGVCNFPTPYDNGPALRDNNFFFEGYPNNAYAGNGTNMWLNTPISLAVIQTAVNSGKIRYILSGYFGGDGTNPTTAQLHMFFNTSGGSNGEVIVGNVTSADRQNKTGLLYREITGFIPSGTQSLGLALQTGITPGAGVYRTGYADNLSLVLKPVQVFLPLSINGLGSQAPIKTGYPAPTGVFITPNGLTRMDIYWTDNTSDERGFEVQRINQDSSVDTICNTKPNWTYCLDPGLSQSAPSGYKYLGSNVTYTYQIRAIGAGIDSNWASGTGTTATEPLTPPSPTHGGFTCQALDTTSSSTTFVWNDPFTYEAGVNIYLGNNASPSWSEQENELQRNIINPVPGSIT